MIEFKNVSKLFGDTYAVRDLNIVFPEHSISMIIGPSGCGKTTTMKMINRLVDPEIGEITLDGQSIYNYNSVNLRRSIGYVIQGTGLFPHYTVYDNIAAVPRLLKWDEKRINTRVMELLDLVTLDETFSSSYPHELSGGEQQRVGIARALASDPELLLMDEPFGAIDPINRVTLQDTLLDIQEVLHKTIVFVTHDINEAIKLGDRIAIMNEGSLVQYGTPEEIIAEPENEFVEALLGHDRNMKALALKKTKEVITDTGYITVSPHADTTSLEKAFSENPRLIAFIVDEGKLAGRFRMEKRKGQMLITRDTDLLFVEKNSNLNETLSAMLEYGEKLLPVCAKKREFLGVVTLGNLFDEVSRD